MKTSCGSASSALRSASWRCPASFSQTGPRRSPWPWPIRRGSGAAVATRERAERSWRSRLPREGQRSARDRGRSAATRGRSIPRYRRRCRLPPPAVPSLPAASKPSTKVIDRGARGLVTGRIVVTAKPRARRRSARRPRRSPPRQRRRSSRPAPVARDATSRAVTVAALSSAVRLSAPGVWIGPVEPAARVFDPGRLRQTTAAASTSVMNWLRLTPSCSEARSVRREACAACAGGACRCGSWPTWAPAPRGLPRAPARSSRSLPPARRSGLPRASGLDSCSRRAPRPTRPRFGLVLTVSNDGQVVGQTGVVLDGVVGATADATHRRLRGLRRRRGSPIDCMYQKAEHNGQRTEPGQARRGAWRAPAGSGATHGSARCRLRGRSATG